MARKNISMSDKLIGEEAKVCRYCQEQIFESMVVDLATAGYIHLRSETNLSGTEHMARRGADWSMAERELLVLRSLIQQYEEDFVFNADKCGLFYRRTPTSTVGPAPPSEQEIGYEENRLPRFH